MEEKIIQYINQDLYQEISATSFDEFEYNMESDSSFNAIKDVYSKLEDLKKSHEKVTTSLEELCNGVYSAKTDVCSELRNFGKLIGVHLSDIDTTMDDMTQALKTVLEEQVRSDESLVDDLQKISELLGEEFDASKYTSSSNAGAPAETGNVTATTTTVENEPVMAGPEPQEVKTMTQEPQPEQPASNPQPSGGSTSTTISPGTTATPYDAKSYSLSDEEYRVFCATIYAEATENPQYCYSDSMGVTSVMLNRLESGNYNSVTDVVSASGQFAGYGYQNRKFSNAMSNPSVIPPEMMRAINDTLAGKRNTNGLFFSGNGVYNKFR